MTVFETSADLDACVRNFRLANRELFNNHFLNLPCENKLLLDELFFDVEDALFESLVLRPTGIPRTARYGDLQPNILVKSRGEYAIPVMLNREIDSGYWDYPLTELRDDSRLHFIEFFDFDRTANRDHRFVKVRVANSQAHPDIVSKHGLVESSDIRFELAET